MAVGASRPRVVGTILRGALVQVGIGVAIGLPAAFIAGRLLQARLFGVSAVRSARDRRRPGAARVLGRDRGAAARRTRGTHGSGQGASDRLKIVPDWRSDATAAETVTRLGRNAPADWLARRP